METAKKYNRAWAGCIIAGVALVILSVAAGAIPTGLIGAALFLAGIVGAAITD